MKNKVDYNALSQSMKNGQNNLKNLMQSNYSQSAMANANSQSIENHNVLPIHHQNYGASGAQDASRIIRLADESIAILDREIKK